LGQKPFELNEISGAELKENLTPYIYCEGSSTLFSDTTLLVNQSHRLFFRIKNVSNKPLSRVLTFGKEYLYVKGVKIERASNKEAFIQGELTNNFKIELEEGESKTVFFTINELNKKDPRTVSVSLFSENLFAKKQKSDANFKAFFLGLVGFLCFFNFILFFITKWKVYLKYALYIFTALFYFSYYYGVLQWWFPSLNGISSNHVHIWYNLMFISYFYFINDFGEYKKYVPKAYFLLNVGLAYKLVQTIFNSIFHVLGTQFIYSNTYISIAMGFELILMGSVVFYILKNKRLVGRVVIGASLLMTVGGILDQLIVFGVTPQFYYVEISIILELLTFSLGLGLVNRQYYQDKISMQHLYIKQLQETEQIKTVFADELESKIKLRTQELEEEKKRVEEKNEENKLLLGEIHHRVKNNLQVISSMLNLQQRNIDDPKAKSAIIESKERIKSIVLIHKMLYQNDSFLGIDMCGFIHHLIEELTITFGVDKNNLKLDIECSKLKLDVDTAIPLGLILDELLINCLKYASTENGNLQIRVVLEEKNGQLILTVCDNGRGKVSDLENANSFGMKLIKSLTRQISGQLTFDDVDGLKVILTINDYKIV
jgi:two-component sensor histidine kinase